MADSDSKKKPKFSEDELQAIEKTLDDAPLFPDDDDEPAPAPRPAAKDPVDKLKDDLTDVITRTIESARKLKGSDFVVFHDDIPIIPVKKVIEVDPLIAEAEKILSEMEAKLKAEGAKWGEEVDSETEIMRDGKRRRIKDDKEAIIELLRRRNTEGGVDLRSCKFLVEKKYKPADMLIQGFIPKHTLGMVVGAPAVSKSWLVMDTCLRAAAGLPTVFGGAPKEPVVTLYLDGEQGDDETSRRLTGLVNGLPTPEAQELAKKNVHFAIYPEIILDDESNGIEKLKALIAEAQPSLVVLDTYRRFASGEENSSESSNAIYRRLKTIMANGGPSVMLVHHRKKTNTNESGEPDLMDVRGSTDITAALGACFIIAEKQGEQSTFLVYEKKKKFGIKTEDPIEIHIDGLAPEAVHITTSGYVAKEKAESSGLSRNIKEWMTAEGITEFRPKTVKTKFVSKTVTERAVDCALEIMIDNKVVKKIGYGRYQFNPPKHVTPPTAAPLKSWKE